MIYMEDDIIKMNGVVLPGVVKSIEIVSNAMIDEQEVEGSATKPKQATGYEDAKINIELILDDTPTHTKYQRLDTLKSIFRKDGQEVPQPIPIVSEDTAAHGIEKVLFKKISHKAESKRGQLPVSIELWEYIPQIITATKNTSGSSGGSGSSTSAARTSSIISEEYGEYLSKNRGKSPAKDDAKPMKSIDIKGLPF